MSTIRLSICIPVYNFGAFIGETLESILHQATDEVEVLVVDGASTDDTAQVVGRYQKSFPSLNYHRLEARGGIDRDMAKAVELAHGEYCWLFSGDDLMRQGAVSTILSELAGECDVYLVEAMLCDFHMKPLYRHAMLDGIRSARTFRLHDERDRLEYFRRSRNTGAFFSFCSALVIRKARWDATAVDESFMGTCWAHAARIFAMIRSGLVVRYLPEPFLDKRGDNDSFLTNGLTHRFGIAVDGFHTIADTFFGPSSAEAFFIRRALRRELPWAAWISARIEISRKTRRDQYPTYQRLVRKQFCDRSVENSLSKIACLTPAFGLARGLAVALGTYQILRSFLVGQRAQTHQ